MDKLYGNLQHWLKADFNDEGVRYMSTASLSSEDSIMEVYEAAEMPQWSSRSSTKIVTVDRNGLAKQEPYDSHWDDRELELNMACFDLICRTILGKAKGLKLRQLNLKLNRANQDLQNVIQSKDRIIQVMINSIEHRDAASRRCPCIQPPAASELNNSCHIPTAWLTQEKHS
jgi:hypothetical protein